MATAFLFNSFDSKPPQSLRKQHLKTVYDILCLCVLRQDLPRARRAWAILIRCPDFDTNSLWRIGLSLIAERFEDEASLDHRPRLDFLRAAMLREKENKEQVLIEIILLLIKAKRYREALDEIDLYIPSFPYQDSPVLHTYAGALKLYLAQPNVDRRDGSQDVLTLERTINLEGLDPVGVQDAQVHFSRAREVDPANAAAEYFLSLLQVGEKDVLSQDEDEDLVFTRIASTNGMPQRPRKRFKA